MGLGLKGDHINRTGFLGRLGTKSTAFSVVLCLVPAITIAQDTSTLFEKPKDKNVEAEQVKFNAPIAQPRKGFFDQGTAGTVFGRSIDYHAQPEIQYFPAIHKLEEEKPELEIKVVAPVPGARIPDSEIPTSPAEVVTRFGDPEGEAPITAIEDAPKPFKGMMAALQVNDETLAYKYARQYVRHVRNLQERSRKVMSLTGLAMEREGLADEKGWQRAPQFKQDRHLLEEDLKKAGIDKSTTENIQLDARTRALIERAEAEEDSDKHVSKLAAQNQLNPELQEKQARAQFRLSMQGRVPLAPEGKVDIYFFFRPKDVKSLSMVPDIESLYRLSKEDKRINLVGLTFDSSSPDELKGFQLITNTTFPVLSGQALAKQLKLTNSPTTVFTTSAGGQSVVRTGPQKFYQLEELLKLMQGR